jgi:hypothetical protein
MRLAPVMHPPMSFLCRVVTGIRSKLRQFLIVFIASEGDAREGHPRKRRQPSSRPRAPLSIRHRFSLPWLSSCDIFRIVDLAIATNIRYEVLFCGQAPT